MLWSSPPLARSAQVPRIITVRDASFSLVTELEQLHSRDGRKTPRDRAHTHLLKESARPSLPLFPTLPLRSADGRDHKNDHPPNLIAAKATTPLRRPPPTHLRHCDIQLPIQPRPLRTRHHRPRPQSTRIRHPRLRHLALLRPIRRNSRLRTRLVLRLREFPSSRLLPHHQSRTDRER